MNIEDKHRIISTHFDFIKQNLKESAKSILLKYHKKLPFAALLAVQIEAQQKIIDKWPEFYLNPDVVLPPLKNLAQSSSINTAKTKFKNEKGKTAIDLTGGFGIDSMILAEQFEKVMYVEQNPDLFALAEFNFKQTGKTNIICIHSSAEEFLKNLSEKVSLIYLDPARKKDDKNVFMLHDLSPNFFEIEDLIRNLSDTCILKCSPLLDTDYIKQKINHIEKIQSVSVGGECKEINLKMNFTSANHVLLEACCDFGTFQFSGKNTDSNIACKQTNFIYDLDAACVVLKVSDEIALHYQCEHIQKTPFFISEEWKTDFPGKTFQIIDGGKFNKSAMQQLKEKAFSVKARNYEESADEIRKKLKLKQSDSQALFVFRNPKKEAEFYIAEKIKP